MIIASMLEHKQANKVNKKLEHSRDKAEKNQPFLKKMNIPSDLKWIQPIATHVCNCDEIGFDPNGNRNGVVCT